MGQNVFIKSIFILLILITCQTAFSQTSFDPNNLSNVNVDLLSDEQILSIINQGGNTGLNLEQSEELAKKRGLNDVELQKLKARISKIQNNNSGGINSQTDLMNAKQESADTKTTIVTGKAASNVNSPTTNVSIFGQQFFRNGDLKTFDKSTDAKAPNNYIIGIGDEIGISIYGFSYYNDILKVDSKGAINPNQLGPIYIRGLTFENAKKLIRKKCSQYFDLTNNKIDITISYSRSITVNIVGEVFKPGSYTIPAINTAFNALIIAGGPNDIGSLRNIQIRRAGKLVKSLDVYTFLNDPAGNQDYYLEENDYIVVVPSKRIIKIEGEVKTAMAYELKSDENLNALIKYTGGFNANALTEKIKISRFGKFGREIIDIDYKDLLNKNIDFKLLNGDNIIVANSSLEFKNAVEITGLVNFPGVYNIIENEKVSDLIRKAGGLKFGAVSEKAFIERKNKDESKSLFVFNVSEILNDSNSASNFQLIENDKVLIYSYKSFSDSAKITILGSIRNPGEIIYKTNMTLGDALLEVGGLKFEGDALSVEISRLNVFSPDYIEGQPARIIIDKIPISKDLLSSNKAFDYKLQPFDQVFARKIVDFSFQNNMEIIGEVKYPGVYTLKTKSDKVSDLISRSGGLTKYAFTEGATLYRKDLAGNYIVLKLDKVLKNQKSKYNYILHDGDKLIIPEVIDFVAIRGSSTEFLSLVNRDQINAPYISGRRAKYYIDEFGNGFTKQSWRRKTYVVENNYKINRTRNFLLFKIYPKVRKGSTIYVVNKPIKEKKQKNEKGSFDINNFIEKSMVKLTGIITVYFLINQLN